MKKINKGFTQSVEDGDAQDFSRPLTVNSFFNIFSKVKKTDTLRKKSSPSFTAGFTLIELLVVIGIIAIIATIVIALIGNQNKKALDKKIQQQVSSMRPQAQLYTGTMAVVPDSTAGIVGVAGPAGGSTLFNDSTFVDNSLFRLISGLPSGTIYYYAWNGVAPSAGGQWVFAATTSTGTVCADWNGASKTTTIMPTSALGTWAGVVNALHSCL
jgi:prepilin-type N-terminal cleavage/methylation domain-containing protein